MILHGQMYASETFKQKNMHIWQNELQDLQIQRKAEGSTRWVKYVL